MAANRTLPVDARDGEFDLHLWTPRRDRPGPAIVLLQEIFGVGEYIDAVATELAGRGYLVGAPDLFWRLERNYTAPHTEEGTDEALGMMGRFDFQRGVDDAARAEAALSDLAECDGRVGVLGFCLGGAIGHVLAAASDPDVLVSFYGSGVPDATDLFAQVTCPALYVFGGSDPYIPRDRVATVEGAARARDNVTVTVYEDAGHAFHNHKAPMFHNPAAAEAAWEQATRFLDRHLPVDR